MAINWSELNLPTVALLIVGFVAIELARNYKGKKVEAKTERKDDTPTIPADAFAKMVAAAVSEANKPFRELVGNNTEAIENNTKAINEMRVSMTQINGKADTVLRDTQLLLQRGHNGGGGA